MENQFDDTQHSHPQRGDARSIGGGGGGGRFKGQKPLQKNAGGSPGLTSLTK